MSGSIDDFKEVSLPKAANSKRLWRSIDELNDSPAFLARVKAEFPDVVDHWTVESPETASTETLANADVSRRTFLGVMSAGMALLGMTGCSTRQPDQKILPYVNQPEYLVPGRPLFFASTLTIGGYAHGVLIEQHEGRPTKIEGNPDHPASLGATNIFMQAAILQMYEPDRAQVVLDHGVTTRWSAFADKIAAVMAGKGSTGGEGFAILAEPSTSPTLARQIAAFKKKHPKASWHTWSPVHRNNVLDGAQQAFVGRLVPVYHFDQASSVLSLDSDFFTDEPGSLAYARQFMDRRRVRKGSTEMNRLYVLESVKSITGAAADHRFPLSPENISATVHAIAASLGIAGAAPSATTGIPAATLAAIVEDLQKSGKNALVIAGESQPADIHALVHAINAKLGAVGNTITYIDSPEIDPDNTIASIKSLVDNMSAGKVDTLLILGGNPVYNAPADLNFQSAMGHVALRMHLSLFEDETSFQCHWHLPMSHQIESWSDARAYDGTISIGQPLIAPLYATKNVYEVMSMVLGDFGRTNYDIIRTTWQESAKSNANFGKDGSGFDSAWETWLREGVIAGSASASKTPRLVYDRSKATPTTQPTSSTGYTVVFRPDPSIGDGEWANSAWLQELPKPISKLTWDNVAMMSYATAKKLGVEKESTVDLKVKDKSVGRAAVLPMAGMPDGVISVTLGYGRTMAGEVGNDHGFNAYSIRTTDGMWQSPVEVFALDHTYKLAISQETQVMHGRELLRVKPISNYGKGEEEFGEHEDKDSGAKSEDESAKPKTTPLTLYQPWDYTKGNQWGMVIDNNACIGCNACVVGCMSENNIPTVGKEQVINGRIMHWLRIDTYFESEMHEINDQVKAVENPDTYFEPVACMHCENAPCEVVCPVGATVHDVEGTNNMVYNRCVGTRYCSNNCPYKVRRFNYLSYNWTIPESLRLMKNPDVTIRNRGIMEKCSYCIQRISHARIEAKKQDRPIRDGEVVTACQQACPTQAITFGNTLDGQSAVAKLKTEPENWGLLTDLNTQPRTTYLTKFKNPNPAMKA